MDFTEIYPDSSSSVALACRSGDLDTLKRLVHQGKSIECLDNRGWRPIHEAACWGHAECLQFLLEHSSTHMNAYTFEGQTALWIAADNNSLEAARVLLEAGGLVNLPNNEDVTPLHCAASKGFTEMTELLLANGANVNLPDYGMYTPLHEAAIQGHFSIVAVLLKNGADKAAQDSHGRTPLFCGAQSHSCQVVGLLLEETPPSLINLRAHDGATTIMLAAQSGCIECIKLLVDHGANPNLKANDGVMAVHLAVVGNHREGLQFLLGITDHTFIEQSCAINVHSHSHRSMRGPSWSHNDMESVNIFALAVTYDRLDLINVLIEGGLQPDFYPFPLKFNNPGGIALRGLGYKWHSPLSFLLSHMPFHDLSFETVKFLVTKGSSIRAIQPGFVPPVIALIALANWEGDCENNLSFTVLDFLLCEYDALRMTLEELSEMTRIALCMSPSAFLHILHHGYYVDDAVVLNAFQIIRQGIIQRVHTAAMSSLHAAGFLIVPCITGDDSPIKQEKVVTLKQLSRKAIHFGLKNHPSQTRITELNLPLPSSLIKYLCFDDVNF